LETLSLPLRGRGNEPVDLARTLLSHGLVSLPPMDVAEDGSRMTLTLPLRGSAPRTATLTQKRRRLSIEVSGRTPSARAREQIVAQVAYVLRLDEDLSDFYGLIAADPDLAWAVSGAGRLVRSPTAFEDVVKTICTTNCSWAATTKMVTALVQHLGDRAAGAPKDSVVGRCFPTPAAMADADEPFYREVVRAGYRGPYLRSLASSVVSGEVDLDRLASATPEELSDEELDERLRALPGVGPYASAHVMMMFGRYSPLILDSWTRPKYARLMSRRKIADATILRRFKRYGRWAGLAFWLFLTRDWIDEPDR
jgi:N-glycosylase/DNA lyase